ncbi:MAG: hypothetical protein HXY21_11075 [Parvularculaceae bacterium]|nr:hypothetical protein [Parvularculaceae bacterium]
MTTRIDRAAMMTIGASAAAAIMPAAAIVLDNPGEIAAGDVVRPIFFLVGAALIVPAALFAVGGAGRFAALAFPIALFAFFKFTGFYTLAEFAGLHGAAAAIGGAIAFALICVAAADVFRRRDAAKLASFVFAIFGAIAAGSGAMAALTLLKANKAQQRVVANMIASAPQPALGGANLPDVIYIVPDRYGSDGVLASMFEFDNGEFLDALADRGVFVRRDARSNYAKTIASLASTLNMTDLSPLAASLGPNSGDLGPLRDLIRDNAAQRTLRSAGYSYLHFGSWWEPTRRNPHADANFYGVNTAWSGLSEFERTLLRYTPLSWIATDGASAERRECERLKSQLDRLETVRKSSPGPVFAFAHLTLPHEPITMNKDGACIEHIYFPSRRATWEQYKSAYRDYVAYLNKRLIGIFDANKAADDGRGMIFVIQADEGPFPRRLELDLDMNMHEFNEDEVRQKFGIINALYWDRDRYGPPYLTQTPINNWRLILSKISGETAPLVADERSLLMRSEENVYDMIDVTGVLAGKKASALARLD